MNKKSYKNDTKLNSNTNNKEGNQSQSKIIAPLDDSSSDDNSDDASRNTKDTRGFLSCDDLCIEIDDDDDDESSDDDADSSDDDEVKLIQIGRAHV